MLNIETILQQLPSGNCKIYYVAYSGGLDSTVLLHLLWQAKLPIQAIHINHQLQKYADDWENHCKLQCQKWNIPFISKKIQAKSNKGESPEAAARAARYAAFAEIMQEKSVLCTAHHQDDQAETLLLQLIRGAGVAGLAAMPFEDKFNHGLLCRPLLQTTREDLLNYAKKNELLWIDDPSNQDYQFDRNYIRGNIMPLLKKRWPSVTQTIARSSEHCAEAAELLHQQAIEDYQQVKEGNILSIQKLNNLSSAKQKNVIRYWLAEQQFPLPSTAQLEQIQTHLLKSREDANPLVHWSNVNIQRYRDHLYANKISENINLTEIKLNWDLQQDLLLPYHLGYLSAHLVKGQGIRAMALQEKKVSIQFRHGGERCKPQERTHSQTLKNLFQEYAIPVWKRDKIPILYCEDEIAAVIQYWICANYSTPADEMGWVISWNTA